MDTSRKITRLKDNHILNDNTADAHASAYVSLAAFDLSLFVRCGYFEPKRSLQAVFLYVSLIWVQIYGFYPDAPNISFILFIVIAIFYFPFFRNSAQKGRFRCALIHAQYSRRCNSK